MLIWARLIAGDEGRRAIGPREMLLGMFRENLMAEEADESSLQSLLLLSPSFLEDLELRLEQKKQIPMINGSPSGDLPLSSDGVEIISKAQVIADQVGSSEVTPIHVLAAILEGDGPLRAHLEQLGLTVSVVYEVLKGDRSGADPQ